MTQINEIRWCPAPPVPPSLPSSKSKLIHQAPNTCELLKLDENELNCAIKRFVTSDNKFNKIFYIKNTCLRPQLQIGPKCGLVALSIATSVNENFVSVNDIFQTAISLGFTKQGEIFSAKALAFLAEKCCGFKSRIIEAGLNTHLFCILKSLLSKCLLLVPYDADFNHSPCCKKGLKAHWAVISGFFIVKQRSTNTVAGNNSFAVLNCQKCSVPCKCIDAYDNSDLPLTVSFHQERVLIGKNSAKEIHSNFEEGKLYLIGMQGKSKHPGLWLFDKMADSNGNLILLSSTRNLKHYVLPEGGLQEGLKGKAIILDYS